MEEDFSSRRCSPPPLPEQAPLSPLLPFADDGDGGGVEAKQRIRRDIRQPASTEEFDESQPISVVRQNLLGPLTFDDLYYV
jgi:hypothetical protein